MTTESGGPHGAASSSVSGSVASKTSFPEHQKGQRVGHSDLRRIIRDKLRGGVYGLGRMRRGQRRSAVWEHFRMVEDEKGMSVGYAGCLHCLDVLRHDPHLSGTSSLFSHLRSCSARLDSTPSTVPLSPETNVTLGEVTVKEEVLEDVDTLLTEVEQQVPDPQLLEACVDCLASDLLPPHALHSTGFLRLAQLLLEWGMKGGAKQVLEVLPSQKQVEERVAIRASKARQHLLGRLKGGAGLPNAALVLCEMPTQQQGPRALLLRTLQEWRLHTHFLGLCPPLAEAERRDPRTEVAEVLKKFQLREAWEECPPLVWSSEIGVNDDCVVPCASYMLGRAVGNLFETPKDPLPQVREYLDKCRDLVRWAAEEDEELAERLVTDDGDTRAWRRTLAMVESVCAVRVVLGNAWLKYPPAVALGDAAVTLLKQLLEVLQPVSAAAAELEATHVATLHKVVPWLLHLRNACQPATGDEAATASMKAALREGLDKHATPTPMHHLAVFFNPRMSSLRVLAPEEQWQVRETVLNMAPQAPSPAVEDDNKQTRPLAYLEDARPAGLSVEREVEMYGIMQDDADPDDLLAWWSRNATLLPLLAGTAARVLAVPACTATPAAATVVLEDLSKKLLGPLYGDPAQADDLALLHARLAGL